VNRWKEPVRGEKSSQKPWQVLVVAFYMPLLERSFIRDFSLLCLEGAREVGGDVEKVRSCWLCRAALKMGFFSLRQS
jgi:hypothetical protein